jgi:hypothetical protein
MIFTDPTSADDPDPDSLGYVITDAGEEDWIKAFPV